jgi:hypothetical protein
MGLETEDESGEGGADDESADRERLRRRSGLRIFFKGRSNAAAGASSKTGASCLPAAEPELTPFPFQPLPWPPPPSLPIGSIPACLQRAELQSVSLCVCVCGVSCTRVPPARCEVRTAPMRSLMPRVESREARLCQGSGGRASGVRARHEPMGRAVLIRSGRPWRGSRL